MAEQQKETPTETILRDGRAVTIRPLGEGDRAALAAFGQGLPETDLLYLEDDMHNAEIISRLINARFAENWRQLVAAHGGAIAGYSAVRRLPGWSSHVADIRLLVGEEWRRLGLGTALAQAIFDAARDLGVDKVIVEMLEEQAAGQAIFERLGFRAEGLLSDQVHDRQGQRHNLLIMAYHVK